MPCSGDDVRHVRIDDQLDLVLEHQLALLQPRELELIAGRLRGKQPDLLVELAVLGLQQSRACPTGSSSFIVRLSLAQSARAGTVATVHGEQHRSAGRTVRRAKTNAANS